MVNKLLQKLIKKVEKEEGRFRGNPPKLKIVKKTPKAPIYTRGKYYLSRKTGKRRAFDVNMSVSKSQLDKLKKHPDILKEVLLHELRETRAIEKGAKSEYQSHQYARKKENEALRRKYLYLKRKRRI